MMKAIVNARAVLPSGVIENCTVLLDGERIAAVGKDLAVPEGAERIDAGGCYVGPGFVDIHVHGSGRGGVMWPDGPAAVAAHHLRHGTTSICAYLSYGYPKEALIAAAKTVQSAIDAGLVPSVIGIGFEGPYINHAQGANSSESTRCGPDRDEYERLYDACRGHIVQWMYAPEEDRDGAFGDFLRDRGVTAAVGHTCASPAQIRAAVDKGASVATHLYDAMGCWRGNDSVLETGTIQDSAAVGCLVCPELTFEIIPDSLGKHVKPANMRLAYLVGGPGRVAIITDCCPCDYDPADYPAGSLRSAPDLNFNKKDELAGSTLTMDQAFRNFVRHTGVSVTDAFRMAATTPARAVHIDRDAGSVVPGKYANLVFLDGELALRRVIFRGETVE